VSRERAEIAGVTGTSRRWQLKGEIIKSRGIDSSGSKILKKINHGF